MTLVEQDGDHIDFIEPVGLGSAVRHYTRNEALHIYDQLHAIFYPPPLAESGPDEPPNE